MFLSLHNFFQCVDLFFHVRQRLLLDHSGMEGVSSRITFESSGSLEQEYRPFFGFWYLHVGMDNLTKRIDDRQSFKRSRHRQKKKGFWYLHYGHYYINGSTALRSLIYVDVGEPTSHPCSMTGMIQDHHLLAPQDFESLGTSMCGICYDIAKQY